jgi:Mg2+/Co2+ transporter CorC
MPTTSCALRGEENAFDRLGLRMPPAGFDTIADFALSRFVHLPEVGEQVDHEGWRFEIVAMDGRRIDKLLAKPLPAASDISSTVTSAGRCECAFWGYERVTL